MQVDFLDPASCGIGIEASEGQDGCVARRRGKKKKKQKDTRFPVVSVSTSVGSFNVYWVTAC